MAKLEYRGSTALITGGASGIGEALARELAQRGVHVAIADRQIDKARALAAELTTKGVKSTAYELDIRDLTATREVVAACERDIGPIDWLFANAGIGIGGEALEYTDEDWRYVIEVTLLGTIYTIHAVYPRMVERRRGHIVATSSMSGLMPSPLTVGYGTAKHGVVGFCRSLRAEAHTYGVHVTALCPGVIRTPIMHNAGVYGRFTRQVPTDVTLAQFEPLRPMNPDAFARRVLNRLPGNPGILVVPDWWKLVWWLNRLSPATADWLSRLAVNKMRAAVAPYPKAP